MNDKKPMIEVLWIDDDPQRGFMKDAFNQKQIRIDVAQSVNEGLNKLRSRDKFYEAIILDANCVINPGEVEDIDALTYAIVNLYRMRIEIPWFVYTAGGEKFGNVLPYLIPKDQHWKCKQYYDKPADAEELLDDIRSAVELFETTRIKNQYPEIFSLYSGKDLLELIQDMNNADDFDMDFHVPGRVRLIIDWICEYLSKIGLVPFEFEASKITNHSKFIGRREMEEVFPLYIQRLIFFLVDYSNNGNHRNLPTCTDIREGRAKYVNRTAILALLNILRWLHSLSTKSEDEMDRLTGIASEFYSLSYKTKQQ